MFSLFSNVIRCLIALGFLTLALGCDNQSESASPLLPAVAESDRTPVTYDTLYNEEATIPPQCYTKTEGKNNPCYVCHQAYEQNQEYRMNKLNDGGIQGAYLFSDIGQKNHWRNLFVDRSAWVEKISDEAIKAYIAQDNYSPLAKRLSNNDWQGYFPDLNNLHLGAKAFNAKGIAKDGSGWVAFNYKPLPSTFWPTNGSTDDVMIRLPEQYRSFNGQADNQIYLLNLSLVEMSIKQISRIDIAPFNELQYELDINGDGSLTPAVNELVSRSNFVGDASEIAVPLQQFPLNTEFLHSVRYVGVEGEAITVSTRMKELRYMKKIRVLTDDELASRYNRERKEKLLEELPSFVKLADKSFENGMGWTLQGFIEDYDGALRPQTHEEMFFCMGCHSAIGATIDQTFSFARKVTGESGWGYINLKGMQDAPSLGQAEGEILQYLKTSGGGNEFRENQEMADRFYNSDGSVKESIVKASDVYALITPSVNRALKLNKAYTHIVRHQSFVDGRDATWSPAKNVHKTVDESVPPLAPEHRLFGWDMRLDWSK